MRQETNNEIDLLLRRLSRRQAAPQSDGDLRIDSDHLDADELSAYAENVLPAAARARYTEHLADCSKCRELVVQLSASVPVVAAKETVSALGPSGLRKFLASLFSPMVLRYAVPALGLIVVAAIGFLVFRSNERGTSVAQLEGSTQSRPAAIPTEQPQAATHPYYDSQTRTETPSPAARRELDAERSKETGPAPAPPNAPPTVSSVRVEPKTDVAAAKTEGQTVAVSNAAAPQPTPKPGETVDEMRVEIEGRKPNAQDRAAAVARQRNLDFAKDGQKKLEDADAAKEPAKAKAAGARPQSGVGVLSAAEAEKDRDDSVIRSVGGRRFRKQNGVWVDTAYDSGSAVVNLARGSEQYRALVGDEPTIKTIADQLDGTIIVVWKGRTYRIR